jgi:hypothetical protein
VPVTEDDHCPFLKKDLQYEIYNDRQDVCKNSGMNHMNLCAAHCKIRMEMKEIKYILRVGKAIHALNELYEQNFFDDLSKHNTQWESENEKEAEALLTLKNRLLCIEDRLEEILELLTPEDIENE